MSGAEKKDPPTPAAFALKAIGCAALAGFEVMAFWADPEPGKVIDIRARHPYGPWRALRIFQCNGATCESENGSPMCAPDVARRMRRLLFDRQPRPSQMHLKFAERVERDS